MTDIPLVPEGVLPDTVSFPLAVGVGFFVFFASVIIGQYAWRRMRRQIFFERTSMIGEPTLLGLMLGFVLGASCGIAVFFGSQPQYLNNIGAVVGISVVLSLLTFGVCCLGSLYWIHADLRLEGGSRCHSRFTCCVSLSCGLAGALAVGIGLGVGLKPYIQADTATETLQLSRESVIIGIVVLVVIVVLAALGFHTINRLGHQHSLRQARNTVRLAHSAPERAKERLREMRYAFAQGLHARSDGSAVRTALATSPIFDRHVVGEIFDFLAEPTAAELEAEELDGDGGPDDASLDVQLDPLTPPAGSSDTTVSVEVEAHGVAGLDADL